MSVRLHHERWVVEVYDPETKKKRQLNLREIRALGHEPPRTERAAKRIERAALNARDRRRPGARDETCDSFAIRWPDDYRLGRGGQRAASTVKHNRERVKRFAESFAGRPVRDVTRAEARAWANRHPSTVNALRAMFSDAVVDNLADENPFGRLGIEAARGRRDITVLTREEVDELAAVAERMHGELFGPEVAAMVLWGAYTCMRPGETFAARYSRLAGDEYDLQAQFNSRLREETAPKHNSTGLIYVPEPAQRAVLDKPRRLGDDLIFRTKRGHQFRQESWSRTWELVRAAFVASLAPGHHLRRRLAEDPRSTFDFAELRHFGASYMLNVLELEPWVIAEQLRHSDGGALVVQLYGHPDRKGAIERIRRAYGDVRDVRGKRSPAAAAAGGNLGGAG